MKQVTAYKTSDGQLYSNKEQAERHEKDLLFRKALNSFIDERTFYEVSDWFRELSEDEGKELFEVLKLKYG